MVKISNVFFQLGDNNTDSGILLIVPMIPKCAIILIKYLGYKLETP